MAVTLFSASLNAWVLKDREIKGFAIDLEGTTVDLEAHHQQAHHEVARRVGVDLDNMPLGQRVQEITHYVGGPDEKVMEDIRNYKTCDRRLTVEQMLAYDKAAYQQILYGLNIIEPRKGVMQTLTTLRREGFSLAIGTLTNKEEAEYILNKSGLLPLFNHVVVREDVQRAKPHPDVYHETARRMGIEPYEQVVLEDSHNGVIAAKAAGVKHVIGMPVLDDPVVHQRLIDVGANHVVPSYEGWPRLNTMLQRQEGVFTKPEGNRIMMSVGDLGYQPGLNWFARR